MHIVTVMYTLLPIGNLSLLQCKVTQLSRPQMSSQVEMCVLESFNLERSVNAINVKVDIHVQGHTSTLVGKESPQNNRV